MAATSTSANTNTYLRKPLVLRQFKLAFQKLMKYTDEECEKYINYLRDEKIDRITFYAYKVIGYRERESWLELTLCVDWNAHKTFILSGGEKIQLPKSYDHGYMPEISTVLDLMSEFAEKEGLDISFGVHIAIKENVPEYDELMDNLGLVSYIKRVWKSDLGDIICVLDETPKQLPELNSKLLMPEGLL